MPSEILPPRSTGLVDVLDRVLDKGLLIAGDIRISLAEVELLTIRIRLIVCSIDKAQEIGMDWWKNDQHLAPGSSRRRRGEPGAAGGRCRRWSGGSRSSRGARHRPVGPGRPARGAHGARRSADRSMSDAR